MRHLPRLCLVLLAFASPADAGTPALRPGYLCRAAIAAAEHAGTLPPHLLTAIGLVESGRRDPRGGMVTPWPWTIDAAGTPAFFDSKAEAIAAVRTWQARGVLSIDVGCMQVNLLQHPYAFTTLDEAFDPAANVRFAAQFLGSLYARTRAWPAAAALYHSATPELGAAYRRRVLALWPEGPGPFVLGRRGAAARSPLALAWAATLATSIR